MLKTLALPNLFSFNSSAKPQLRSASQAIRQKPVSTFRLWAGLVLAILNFAFLLSYVAGVNSNASKGYEIKQLQNKISRLTDENERLSLKVSEASSMVAIQTGFLNANYVVAGQGNYLQLNQYSQR